MKKFTFLLFTIISTAAFSQTTWINSPFIDTIPPSIHHDSTTVGPKQVCITPNGTIISLVQIDQNHNTRLIATDSLGNIIWNKYAGHHGGIVIVDSYSLNSTTDNGCVYYTQNQGTTVFDTVFRRNSSGNLKWIKTYQFNMQPGDPLVSDVKQTYYNSTIIQFTDSIVEFDSSGNFIQQRSQVNYNAKFYTLPDSNLIRIDSGNVYKERFDGTNLWTINISPLSVYTPDSSNFIYLRGVNSIYKVDLLSGGIIWTKAIFSSALTITNDLGFITANSNDISKYDSSGTLLWTKNIALIDLGIMSVNVLQDQTIIIGGSWRQFHQNYPDPITYNSIFIRTDQQGNGNLDSTDYFWIGNANDDNELSYGNDAVYIAAAFNATGTPRNVNDVLDPHTSYATGWGTSFQSGINHKFSDVDGNGIIDTSDIHTLSYNYTRTLVYPVSPHWQRTSAHTLPLLKFLIPNNQLNIGDTVHIKIILGDNNSPIDSIYGFSFDLNLLSVITNNTNALPTICNIPVSALGDPATNLYHDFIYHSTFPDGIYSMTLCRNDHQNAYVAGDTVANLDIVLNNITSISDTLRLLVNWNAITAGGFPVGLDLYCDSVFMHGIHTGVRNTPISDVITYPVPANNFLSLKFGNELEREITFFNQLGKLYLRNKYYSNEIKINTTEFPNGIYTMNIQSNQKNERKKIIICH